MIAKPSKPRGKPFAKGDDSRRFTGNRVKNDASPRYWTRKFSGMTGAELAKEITLYAKEFRKMGNALPTAAIVAARFILNLANDPDPRSMSLYYEQVDGKQPITFEPSEQLLQKLAELDLTLDDVKHDPLAVALFNLAGVSVNVGVEETDTDSE